VSVVVGSSFTPTPGGRACTDLKYDVASYVMAQNNDRALSKAQDFIRSAVARLNSRNWSWTLNYIDLTTVTGTTTYTVGATFKSPRHLALLDSSGNRQGALNYLDPKSFEYYTQTGVSGSADPFNYTVHSPHSLGAVDLDSSPSSTWATLYPTMRFWYNARVLPCSGSVSFLDVPDEVAEFVTWEAKSLMAAHFDTGKVGFAKAQANQLWTDIIRSDFREQSNDFSAFG
jgi:hypothetical protein